MCKGENKTNESEYKNHPHKLQNKLTPRLICRYQQETLYLACVFTNQHTDNIKRKNYEYRRQSPGSVGHQ